MPQFQNGDGTTSDCTAKQFVLSKYKDAHSAGVDDGYTIYENSWYLHTFKNQPGRVLGTGQTPQKAWLDAARKLEAKLIRGESPW